MFLGGQEASQQLSGSFANSQMISFVALPTLSAFLASSLDTVGMLLAFALCGLFGCARGVCMWQLDAAHATSEAPAPVLAGQWCASQTRHQRPLPHSRRRRGYAVTTTLRAIWGSAITTTVAAGPSHCSNAPVIARLSGSAPKAIRRNTLLTRPCR